MLPFISATLVALLLLLSQAGGHMIMNTPQPYNWDMQSLLQVNPLSGTDFPFPCHNQYGFTSRTLVEAGGATLVNFTGGAQHGGGSCQFSVTYDEPVDGGDWNKSAVFKTIYSIIGGCPAVFSDESHNLAPEGMDGNMRQDSKHCGDDSGVDCIRQFLIPVPKFLKNGPATFAWTWLNKLGNREMYMNCAPINITGGTGDEAAMAELPGIFIANYPRDPEVPNCITGTSADKVVVNYPNPGKYGRVLQAPVEPANKPSSYCSQIPPASLVPTFEPDFQATPSHTNGKSTVTNPVTITTPIIKGTNMPTTDANHSTPPPRLPSNTIPPPAPTTSTIMATNMPIPAVDSTLPPHLASTTPPSKPSFLTSHAPPTTISESTTINLGNNHSSTVTIKRPFYDAIACTTHGALVCLEKGTMFGMCNWGWVVPQEVAVGTECEGGRIVKRGGGEDGWVVDGVPVRVVMEDEDGMVWVPMDE